MGNDEHWLRKLREDVESEIEAQALLGVVRRLNRIDVPKSSPEQTRRLIARLEAELPAPAAHTSLALLRSQARIVRQELWVASVLLMTLGVVLTLSQADTMIFAVIAPFAAAAGIAFIYDSADSAIEELENSTGTAAELLLLARLALVFSFDLALALGSSVILSLILPEVKLLPLIELWFAPMAFLSALAFFLSVMLRDALAPMLFSLTLWVLHLFLRVQQNFWLWTLSLPGLTAPEMRPLLLVAAVGLILAAYLTLVRTEPEGTTL